MHNLRRPEYSQLLPEVMDQYPKSLTNDNGTLTV
jgi:hypothetical protein